MRARGNSGERGGISIIVAFSCVLLAALTIASATYGRIVVAKSDAQRAADSGALLAVELIKKRGMSFDAAKRTASEAISQANSKIPLTYLWTIEDKPKSIDITLLVSAEVSTPVFGSLAPTMTVQARSKATIPQQKFDNASPVLPKVVLVLDYSGSMRLPLQGSSAEAWTLLRDSVRALLNLGLRVEYAAVFYATNVLYTVPFVSNAIDLIRSRLNIQRPQDTTGTGRALRRAADILAARDDTGRYIILVSDGEPCCEGNAKQQARDGAQYAWARDVGIFTLEIQRRPYSYPLTELMIWLAGTPTARHNPDMHHVAADAGTLAAKFRNIMADIVCTIGPFDPPISDPASMIVFLRRPDGEEGGPQGAMPATCDPERPLPTFQAGVPLWRRNSLSNCKTEWTYRIDGDKIKVTEAACDKVMNDGWTISIRHGSPGLAE